MPDQKNALAQSLHEKWNPYVKSLAFGDVASNARPLFVTVSGAHLYGFSSPDSDIDLRGCHLLEIEQVIALDPPNATFEVETIHDGMEVDLVSHDLGKYLAMLTKNNGYVLEQIFSPLVIFGESFLAELRPIAARCITRNHFYHYRGFLNTQLRLIEKAETITAKSVLYAYRVLLTGIHLMQTGEVEANLLTLNEKFLLPGIDELVASKLKEKSAFAFEWVEHRQRIESLFTLLENAFAESTLPEKPDRAAVNELLVRRRLCR